MVYDGALLAEVVVWDRNPWNREQPLVLSPAASIFTDLQYDQRAKLDGMWNIFRFVVPNHMRIPFFCRLVM